MYLLVAPVKIFKFTLPMTLTQSKEFELCSLIHRDFIAISSRETVESTIQFLRGHGKNLKDKSSYLYVVDEEGKLAGVLQMKDLLVHAPSLPITQVMERSVISIWDSASQDDVIEAFRSSSFFALPVVDQTRRITGVIPAASIRRFLTPATSVNFYEFAQFSPEEVESRSIIEIVLRRLPWLLISEISGLTCAYILGIFIGRIESIVALILFVPIVLGLSGSIGTQSAAVTVRGLDGDKLVLTKMAKILGKEIGIGGAIGIFTSILVTVLSLLWRKSFLLGFALGLSIFAAVSVSGLLGFILPVIFRLFRIAPWHHEDQMRRAGTSKVTANKSLALFGGKPGFASGLFLLLIYDTVALILYFAIAFSLIDPMIEIV